MAPLLPVVKRWSTPGDGPVTVERFFRVEVSSATAADELRRCTRARRRESAGDAAALPPRPPYVAFGLQPASSAVLVARSRRRPARRKRPKRPFRGFGRFGRLGRRGEDRRGTASRTGRLGGNAGKTQRRQRRDDSSVASAGCRQRKAPSVAGRQGSPWCALLSCELSHREGAPFGHGVRVLDRLGDRGPHAVGACRCGLVLPAVGAADADRARHALERDPPGAALLLH